MLLLGPFAALLPMTLLARAPTLVLPLLLLPAAVRMLRDFLSCAPGAAYTDILFRTFRLELYFSVLLSAGVLLMRVLR